MRDLDPNDFSVVVSETWSDYDGSSAYRDREFVAGVLTEETSFEPGIGRVTDAANTAVTDYYHADMLGTTRMLTDPAGATMNAPAFMAFGERISGAMSGSDDRYGYAGAWGYQAHADFDFQHVGARYYNPGSGRFLQRDPIGIEGGLNVYGYVGNALTIDVDPTGTINTGRLDYAPFANCSSGREIGRSSSSSCGSTRSSAA